MNKIDLDGRCAIVTGGAQGIGRAVVERFLASGASVAIWDMDGDLTEKARGELEGQGQVMACQVDVTDPAAVERAVHAGQGLRLPAVIDGNGKSCAGNS